MKRSTELKRSNRPEVDTPIDERRFTDREVREILKRAVSRSPSRELVKREGLSLAELKAIGGEAGIDPARLEEAAREIATRGMARPGLLLGAPLTLDVERKVPNEFDPDDAPEVLAIIRRATGVQGDASEIRGSLEWSAESETLDRHVTVSSKDGVTTIRGLSNLTKGAVVTYIPAGVAGFVTTLIGLITFFKDGSEIGLVLAAVVLPVMLLIMRRILGRMSSKEADRLQRLVDDLARFTEQSTD